MTNDNKPSNGLSKNDQKRLTKISKEWETPAKCIPRTLSSYDLRLMLHYFPPLQDLIQQIANRGSGAPLRPPLDAQVQERHSPAQNPQDALQDLQVRLSGSEQQCRGLARAKQELQQDLEVAKGKLREALGLQRETQRKWQEVLDSYQQAQQQLQAAQSAQAVAQQQAEQQQQACNKAQTKVESLQAELRTLQASQARHASLTLLRKDGDLAAHLMLNPLPASDVDALVQVVAVLAQIDNIKRLWNKLKERCEHEKRAASSAELTLWQDALQWHNFNWPSTHHFRSLTPSPACSYDFNQHQRWCHTLSGETLAQVLLPGLADASGKALLKPLVDTR